MSDYGFFLSFNNQAEVFRFPVNPEKMEVKENGDSKSYTIAAFGEVNAILYPKLAEISFESMFPGNWYPFVVESESALKPPLYYLNTIRKWMEERRPIRFVFTGLAPSSDSDTGAGQAADGSSKLELPPIVDFGINMPATIESFEWRTEAGHPEDVLFNLTLKKYRFYEARAVKPVASAASETKAVAVKKPRPDERQKPKTYKLVKGDTLWDIAKKQLGSGARYKEIQKLNGIRDDELKKLQVGRVLKLP